MWCCINTTVAYWRDTQHCCYGNYLIWIPLLDLALLCKGIFTLSIWIILSSLRWLLSYLQFKSLDINMQLHFSFPYTYMVWLLSACFLRINLQFFLWTAPHFVCLLYASDTHTVQPIVSHCSTDLQVAVMSWETQQCSSKDREVEDSEPVSMDVNNPGYFSTLYAN